jgi:hypothetical protein
MRYSADGGRRGRPRDEDGAMGYDGSNTIPSAECSNMAVIGHCDLAGAGDGMHVNVSDGVAYIGHMGTSRIGTSIVDVTDPRSPRVIHQIERPPATHSHKVQLVGDVLVVNHERNPRERDAASWSAGLQVLDVSDPATPQVLGFLETPGKGVHRMTYWSDPYVLMSASRPGFSEQILLIADISDRSNPAEVAHWWIPGMHHEAGERPNWDQDTSTYKAHHAIVRGERAYMSWWDAGFVILDISDINAPRAISHVHPGTPTSNTHTTLPVDGKDLLIVGEESTKDLCQELRRNVYVYDISDEASPQKIATFPTPTGDFCTRGGRFGPHNLHEGRPGSLIDPDTAFLTYFNAGVRVYDLTDPSEPVERGYCIPEAPPGQPAIQMNDITVAADGTIFATDRIDGGLFVMEYGG